MAVCRDVGRLFFHPLFFNSFLRETKCSPCGARTIIRESAFRRRIRVIVQCIIDFDTLIPHGIQGSPARRNPYDHTVSRGGARKSQMVKLRNCCYSKILHTFLCGICGRARSSCFLISSCTSAAESSFWANLVVTYQRVCRCLLLLAASSVRSYALTRYLLQFIFIYHFD